MRIGVPVPRPLLAALLVAAVAGTMFILDNPQVFRGQSGMGCSPPCSAGHYCDGATGTCMPADGPGGDMSGSCTSNDDCGEGYFCNNGACDIGCGNDSDCANDEYCNGGAGCVPKTCGPNGYTPGDGCPPEDDTGVMLGMNCGMRKCCNSDTWGDEGTYEMICESGLVCLNGDGDSATADDATWDSSTEFFCTKEPDCGNGTKEVGEECDDGFSNGSGLSNCTVECTLKTPKCGDGNVDEGEECDLGEDLNGKRGSGCSAECTRSGVSCNYAEPDACAVTIACEGEDVSCKYDGAGGCACLCPDGKPPVDGKCTLLCEEATHDMCSESICEKAYQECKTKGTGCKCFCKEEDAKLVKGECKTFECPEPPNPDKIEIACREQCESYADPMWQEQCTAECICNCEEGTSNPQGGSDCYEECIRNSGAAANCVDSDVEACFTGGWETLGYPSKDDCINDKTSYEEANCCRGQCVRAFCNPDTPPGPGAGPPPFCAPPPICPVGGSNHCSDGSIESITTYRIDLNCECQQIIIPVGQCSGDEDDDSGSGPGPGSGPGGPGPGPGSGPGPGPGPGPGSGPGPGPGGPGGPGGGPGGPGSGPGGPGGGPGSGPGGPGGGPGSGPGAEDDDGGGPGPGPGPGPGNSSEGSGNSSQQTSLHEAASECGNGLKEDDEECDGGEHCNEECELEPFCGDGNIDPGEACDNGSVCSQDQLLECFTDQDCRVCRQFGSSKRCGSISGIDCSSDADCQSETDYVCEFDQIVDFACTPQCTRPGQSSDSSDTTSSIGDSDSSAATSIAFSLPPGPGSGPGPGPGPGASSSLVNVSGDSSDNTSAPPGPGAPGPDSSSRAFTSIPSDGLVVSIYDEPDPLNLCETNILDYVVYVHNIGVERAQTDLLVTLDDSIKEIYSVVVNGEEVDSTLEFPDITLEPGERIEVIIRVVIEYAGSVVSTAVLSNGMEDFTSTTIIDNGCEDSSSSTENIGNTSSSIIDPESSRSSIIIIIDPSSNSSASSDNTTGGGYCCDAGVCSNLVNCANPISEIECLLSCGKGSSSSQFQTFSLDSSDTSGSHISAMFSTQRSDIVACDSDSDCGEKGCGQCSPNRDGRCVQYCAIPICSNGICEEVSGYTACDQRICGLPIYCCEEDGSCEGNGQCEDPTILAQCLHTCTKGSSSARHSFLSAGGACDTADDCGLDSCFDCYGFHGSCRKDCQSFACENNQCVSYIGHMSCVSNECPQQTFESSERSEESSRKQEEGCGDKVLQPGEECDDGNTRSGDGCNSRCRLEFGTQPGCGDAILTVGEECDDGNARNGDGCTIRCKLEIPGQTLVAAAEVCGNGVLDVGEECDDRNRRDDDGCSSTCLLEIGVCGDGIVQSLLGEQCEQALHNVSLSYDCLHCRFVSQLCGDGTVDAGEECDDGVQNSTSPDASCRPDCSLARCGDGIVDSSELCDDGNRVSGDGCDRFCREESEETEESKELPPTQVAADMQYPQYPYNSQFSILNSQFAQRAQFPQYPTFQQLPMQLPLAQLSPLVQTQAPIGDTGPAAVAIIGAGAAAGMGWVRRRKK